MSADNVSLYKKAGGSIIYHKPVLSKDCRTLFIGFDKVLRSFSTKTGEHVQDYEIYKYVDHEARGNIVDIAINPFDRDIILCCYEKGDIFAWSFGTQELVNSYALKLKNKDVTGFKITALPNRYELFDIAVTVRTQNSNKSRLKFFSSKDGSHKHTVKEWFEFGVNKWSVTNLEGKGLAVFVTHNWLNIISTKTYKQINTHIAANKQRKFTCVTCHPTEECIAVGDNTGRVLLYYNFINERKPFYTVYHWHTLPVNDIQFTQLGAHFYTGGSEHVLVKWTVREPSIRHFLPRLSAPIVHITVAPENEIVALSTLDNGIVVVDPLLNITCSIQQFSWGFISMPDQKLFPAGLNVDPRSNSIVTNGRPGYIQFYSPQYSNLLFNVDICEENYVSAERNEKIPNSEVIAIQFSHDGAWLVTSQVRSDPKFSADTFLKFWQFHRKSQIYRLRTTVTLYYRIMKILFQPCGEDVNLDDNRERTDYLVATLCSDGKFRIWIERSVGQGNSVKRSGWNCSSVGFYRDYLLGDICFSDDGSILGAAFGPCLTIWDTDKNTMKTHLVKGSDPIRKIAFGHDDCSFLVISATSDTVLVWNLLSLTIAWSVSLKVTLLVSDPFSGHVAVFTDQNELRVFKLKSSEPVYSTDSLCGGNDSVISAVFFLVKNENQNAQSVSGESTWLCNSSLYFLNSNQELMVFEMKSRKQSDPYVILKGENPASHLQAYMADKVISGVKKPITSQYDLPLKVPWAVSISQLLEFPAHSMPPVSMFCETILKSLLISRSANPELKEKPR